MGYRICAGTRLSNVVSPCLSAAARPVYASSFFQRRGIRYSALPANKRITKSQCLGKTLSTFINETRPNSPEEELKYKPEYEYIEGVEPLERYRPGGYHPINLGDKLCQERYQVLHKLGYGGTSTTWLAEDRSSRQLVAIKIMTTESTHTSQELAFLCGLVGQRFVRQLLDTFSLEGPNGTHTCLVLEARGCSLHAAKDLSYHRLLHLPIARAVIAELALAVHHLHLKGVVHGGNVLIVEMTLLRVAIY